MQIRVKLFVLNENAAKHLYLHLDPCQSPSCRMGSTPRKGMQIRRSVSLFRQVRRSTKIFVQIRNHNHIRKQKCKGSKVNRYIWMPLLISHK